VRLVTNPEKMVIKESLAYLSLYNVSTDLIVANRIIPDQVTDPFFQRWKQSQQQYRQEIHENFSPLPVGKFLSILKNVRLRSFRASEETLYKDEDPPSLL